MIIEGGHPEFQIQMLVDGEWQMARWPDGRGWRRHHNPTIIEDAQKGEEALIKAWKENWCNNPNVPKSFRIVCRMVTEWEYIK